MKLKTANQLKSELITKYKRNNEHHNQTLDDVVNQLINHVEYNYKSQRANWSPAITSCMIRSEYTNIDNIIKLKSLRSNPKLNDIIITANISMTDIKCRLEELGFIVVIKSDIRNKPIPETMFIKIPGIKHSFDS